MISQSGVILKEINDSQNRGQTKQVRQNFVQCLQLKSIYEKHIRMGIISVRYSKPRRHRVDEMLKSLETRRVENMI
jgi:hypothetical protein